VGAKMASADNFSKDSWHIAALKSELKQRKEINASYSLRGFARHIKLPAAVLSEAFRGRRRIPVKHLSSIAERLNFSEEKTQLFIRSAVMDKIGEAISEKEKLEYQELSQKVLEEEIFDQVLAEWEYYAVLSLFKVKNFEASVEGVSTRLGIDVARAAQVLENLETVKLIRRDGDGQLVRNFEEVSSGQGRTRLALRKSHLETLRLASDRLEDTPLDKRYFTSDTLAINVKNLEQARVFIRNFKKELGSILESGEQTEVYQVALQLFPLSKPLEKS